MRCWFPSLGHDDHDSDEHCCDRDGSVDRVGHTVKGEDTGSVGLNPRWVASPGIGGGLGVSPRR